MINTQFKNNYIILIIGLFIFFWDFPSTVGLNFDFRYIVLLLSPFILAKIILDFKKKNFTFFKLSLGLFLFLIFHGFFSIDSINFKFFYSIIFILYLFSVSYYYHNLFLENKERVIIFFIIIFFIYIFINYFLGFGNNPEPYSCGAIKNYLPGKNDINSKYFILHYLSSFEFFFQENSHFAMNSVAVIIFSLYLIIKKKAPIYFGILFFIFFLVSILKMSATLIAGLVVTSLALVLFEYKKIGFFLSVILFSLSIILLYVFFQDPICIKKINPKFQDTNFIENKSSYIKNIYSNFEKKINLQFKKKQPGQDDTYTLQADNVRVNYAYGSTTSAVFFHALNVTWNAFIEKPFGWGFQRYEDAFLKYNQQNPQIPIKIVYSLNSKDGTNNFFKIITEFGIFGFVIYLMFVFILITKKISLENKFFLFPFIITQSIRGAGYFNGGFILIIFVILILQFKKIKHI